MYGQRRIFMYTQNIIFIEKLLSKELVEAKDKLCNFKESMILKYKDDWYEKYLSEEESSKLSSLRNKHQALLAAHDDFKNHTW